jgi:ABC-type Fe3+-siderophore transport system permease subunit
MELLKRLEEKAKKNNLIPAVVLLLIVIFILILSQFFIPNVRELFKGPYLFLLPAIIFSSLGFLLLFLVGKRKEEDMLKKFLILTGVCSGGFFPSIFLHNMIYALFILIFGSGFWEGIGISDEPFFFILAVIIFPIGFLISAVGSLILILKKKCQN